MIKILINRNNTDKKWELPVPTPYLITWCVSPRPIEGSGIQVFDVAAILAHALCVARVSWLSDIARQQRKENENDWWVTSASERVVSELFYQNYFSWTLRGQIVLLSGFNAASPTVPRNFLKLPIEKMVLAAPLAGFLGVFLPGVDGDVAGLWCFDAEIEKQIIAALKAEFLDAKQFAEKLSKCLQ